MTNCKEFVLDDLMAITAIPVTDFNPRFSDWQLKKTIPASQFSPPSPFHHHRPAARRHRCRAHTYHAPDWQGQG